MTDIQLYTEISTLPLEMKQQVHEFIASLGKPPQSKIEIKERQFGYAKGFFNIADDFDEPLQDFKDYM